MSNGTKKINRLDVDKIVNEIKSRYKVSQIYVCGSYRRNKEWVGDIDLVVCADPYIFDDFNGGLKKRVKLIRGIKVEIMFASNDKLGAMLLHCTGSGQFNIILRSRAKRFGWTLNQYGLWNGNELIAAKTEEDIFYSLGLKYIRPEER